jgi:hypothetical protein
VPQEAEVLVPPPSVFRIIAAAMFHGSLVVTLERVDSPLAYLALPPSPAPAPAPVVSGGSATVSLPAAPAAAAALSLSLLPPPRRGTHRTRRRLRVLRPHASRAPQVCSKGADYEVYSAAITRCSFGGDVIDALDINDLTQLMESMGMSTQHKLLLKATFTGWKKSPGAAFEALASAKVAHAEHVAPLLCDVRLQAVAAEKAQEQAAAAKKWLLLQRRSKKWLLLPRRSKMKLPPRRPSPNTRCVF